MLSKSTIPLVTQMTLLFCSRILILCPSGVMHGYHFLNFSKCTHTSVLVVVLHSDNITFIQKIGLHIQFLQTIMKKDLGITFNNNLQFKSHINLIIHKANNNLGIIMRVFRLRDANAIGLLYTTLVRPILDYASTIIMESSYG